MATPILSIVTPTREGFSKHWLREFLKIKGDVELILVHPPGMAKPTIEDPRVQQINSPFRGEIIQRMTGLLNATGTYVLTVNCDEYLNPDIAELAVQYFTQFPDSWVMRLSRKEFPFGKKAELDKPWESLPPIKDLKVCSKAQGTQKLYNEGNYLLEVPIAPLEKPFDIGCFWRGRRDHHGYHAENFDKKVWKTKMVQETLKELSSSMNLFGPFKYVPFWCLDRLLGLSLQAKFYQSGKCIGHLMPFPEQIRIEDNPPEYKRTKRFYVIAEILLLKRFPQYGYLWNLIIHQIVEVPIRAVASIKRRVFREKAMVISNVESI